MNLRLYQLGAVERIRDAIRRGKRSILLVAPCGSGKTVIAAHIIRAAAMKLNYSVFVAHRRELIKQCSGKLTAFDVNHVLLMAGEPMSPSTPTQVCSIQTFNARVGKRIPAPLADLVLVDECHHATANGYLRLKEIYPRAVFLGLTATPCRNDGRGLGHFFDEIIEVATPLELIDLGFLVPTKIVAPLVPNLKGVKVRQGDYDTEELSKRMSPLVGNLIDDWKKYASDRKTIVFATNVAHSVYIQDRFEQAGIRCEHIDGTTPTPRRDEVLRKLKDGRLQVVTNCNILTEGFDEPSVSCAVQARPTKSFGLNLQMIGRVCRPAEGKTDALIIDHAGNVYRHGFPQDAGGWSLDPAFSISKRVSERLEECPRIVTCRECFTAYTKLPHCPACGAMPTKYGKGVRMLEGQLSEVKRKTPKIEVTMEQKAHWYGELKSLELHHGYKSGWAANQYRHRFLCWPNHPTIRHAPLRIPSLDVKNFVRSRQIAYAHAKKRNHEQIPSKAPDPGN